uniref:Uncharacterized protein n=1 Tax=Rhizophora mucronata TaxID=61149 RepID=A0A2P2JXM5_RHIMU
MMLGGMTSSSTSNDLTYSYLLFAIWDYSIQASCEDYQNSQQASRPSINRRLHVYFFQAVGLTAAAAGVAPVAARLVSSVGPTAHPRAQDVV